MSDRPGKTALYQHLVSMHLGSRISIAFTKMYIERAHDAFHRRDPELLGSTEHYNAHIDNGWKP